MTTESYDSPIRIPQPPSFLEGNGRRATDLQASVGGVVLQFPEITIDGSAINAWTGEERRRLLDGQQIGQLVIAPRISPEADDAELSHEELAQNARNEMTKASDTFLKALAEYPTVEPPENERRAKVTLVPAILSESIPSGWQPGRVYEYSTSDPYHDMNPEQVAATTSFVHTVIDQANLLRPTRLPELTYDGDPNRSRHGKRQTILTEAISALDPTLSKWMNELPAAPCLRVVAQPWSNVETIIQGKSGAIEYWPNSPALQAIAGATKGGRGVRERETWEDGQFVELIPTFDLPDKTLRVTSLGTGTGEPGMDASVMAMEKIFPEGDYHIQFNAFDTSEPSLAVADHIAKEKHGDTIEFVPSQVNVMTREGLEKAIGGTQPHIIEGIGLTEYVASDNAPTEEERKQRETMKRRGYLSAQEFYKTVYDAMPQGSVFLTGNMLNDGDQSAFITDGLGWGVIIQRSTAEYMRVLDEAGIPAEAVTMFVPSREHSAADYNLLAIKKI